MRRAMLDGVEVEYCCGMALGVFTLDGEAIISIDKTPETMAEIVYWLFKLGADPLYIRCCLM